MGSRLWVTGSTLFYDKVLDGVNFVSPGTGTVQSIKLGDRRVVEEICIDTSGKDEEFEQSKSFSSEEILTLDKSKLIEILKRTGCWTYIRQRPFSKIANPDDEPKAIFISAFNSAPHAIDYESIFNSKSNGLQELSLIHI